MIKSCCTSKSFPQFLEQDRGPGNSSYQGHYSVNVLNDNNIYRARCQTGLGAEISGTVASTSFPNTSSILPIPTVNEGEALRDANDVDFSLTKEGAS